MLNAIEI